MAPKLMKAFSESILDPDSPVLVLISTDSNKSTVSFSAYSTFAFSDKSLIRNSLSGSVIRYILVAGIQKSQLTAGF